MPEQTAMTIEDCREYSAVEILGFKLDPDSDDWWDTSTAGCYGRGMIPKCGWKPDENRNQLVHILDALFNDDDSGVLDIACDLSGSDDYGKENWKLKVFYQSCLFRPAEALQAICEAHRRHSG